MSAQFVSTHRILGATPKRLNAVMLYASGDTRISTIYEHIDAFRKYSNHNFQFVPCKVSWTDSNNEVAGQFDFSIFDVLIVHYSVRMSLPDHLNEGLAKNVENFRGLKILFIQDEYEGVEIARTWMDRLNFNIVYTCVPPDSRDLVYPTTRFPKTEFLPTLTGYVPEAAEIDQYAIPIPERPLFIAYRGRKLPFVYGTLGHEKYRIGLDVRRLAEERGLAIDIEVEDSKRIYGTDWFRFLGSARATLGTESGSNVFDFDGSIKKRIDALLRADSTLTFERVHQQVLQDVEGAIQMNQVSPKIFESIRLRTALILFEGSYSGTVKPDVHFIPLKKDYSNIEDVFAKLHDTEYLQQLTERAYADIIESGRYSYQNFVKSIDQDIARHAVHGPRYEHFYSTIMARARDGTVRSVLPSQAGGFTLSTQILSGNFQGDQVVNVIGREWRYSPPPPYVPVAEAGPVVRRAMQLVLQGIQEMQRSNHFLPNSIRYCFRRLPPGLRNRIIRSLDTINSK